MDLVPGLFSWEKGKEIIMYIVPHTDTVEFEKRMEDIDSWDLMILPDRDHGTPIHTIWQSAYADFYLGSSQDNKEWTLAMIPWGESGDDDGSRSIPLSSCRAVLVDPTKPQQDDVIFKILLLVYDALKTSPRISMEKMQEIITSVPFTKYYAAGTYLPDLPEDWRNLPVELCVTIELSDEACFTPDLLREFRRATFTDALAVLYGPRVEGITIGYKLVVQDVIPFLPWDVDWPLSRRGNDVPYKRSKLEGTLPWKEYPDQALLTVYQYLPSKSIWRFGPLFYGQPSVRLSVGGRSQEAAVSNWHRCAKALRKIKSARGLRIK